MMYEWMTHLYSALLCIVDIDVTHLNKLAPEITQNEPL